MKTEYNSKLIYVIAVVAATGGLLFGFDTGVISGAIPFFQKDFGIDNGMIEIITASGLCGAILGALFCGKVTDTLGRRKVILASAVVFAIGALWSGFAPDVYHLIASRLFLGVAIGVSSFAVPLYIAEISPAKKRGALVSMFQLMVTIGVLVSYLSDLFFADESRIDCWRPMFYVGVIPAIVLFVGMLCMPETPRWLIGRGREQEGLAVLSRIESPESRNDAFEAIRKEVAKSREEKSGYRELFKPWLRNAVIICIGIMFFQQFVGINTVIYYSPKIFHMANLQKKSLWQQYGNLILILSGILIGALIGVVAPNFGTTIKPIGDIFLNLLFTIVSVYFVDRLGRRKLYFTGLTGITVSLILLGICFAFSASLGDAGKWLSVLLVFFYVAFFAISIGPLGWLIISEVFPQKLRGLGSSIGSLSVWFFNSIVSFTFFKIVHAFTISGTEIYAEGENLGNPAGAFWFYAVVALAALIWGYFYVPETKGVSLEKIEEYWRKGGKPRFLK